MSYCSAVDTIIFSMCISSHLHPEHFFFTQQCVCPCTFRTVPFLLLMSNTIWVGRYISPLVGSIVSNMNSAALQHRWSVKLKMKLQTRVKQTFHEWHLMIFSMPSFARGTDYSFKTRKAIITKLLKKWINSVFMAVLHFLVKLSDLKQVKF